jgi:GT2 family glycosyltransferase
MEARDDSAKHVLPLVSLIVLNYNGAASIAKCLDSIRAQVYQPIETIVVDNASADNSMDIVERLFPEVQTIRNGRNLGFAEGNNVGIRASRGELVVLVNNDLILERNSISELVRGMTEHVGILGGVVYYYYSHDIWSYGGFFEPVTGMHWHAYQGFPDSERLPSRMEVDYVPGALLMIRRNVLDQVGLLSAYFFLYGDDIDLACKVKRLGYSVEVISSSISRHIVSQSVKALNKKHELRGYYLMNKNMFFLYFEQLPFAFVFSASAFQLIFVAFEILVFGRSTKYASTKTRSFSHAIADLPLARIERSKLRDLGKLAIRPKIREFLKVVVSRGASRVYYW